MQEDVPLHFQYKGIRILNKNEIEDEIKELEVLLNVKVKELYKLFLRGEIKGRDALKLAYFYELYVQEYGDYEW